MGIKHRQSTLKRAFSCIGVGLHSGRGVSMKVGPAEANTGIVFVRRDVRAQESWIPARWHRVSQTDLSTTLTNEQGVSVATVEHLLAALRGCGVDNAVVEIDGDEVPIMDGSAAPFVRLIRHAGLARLDVPRFVMWLHDTIEVQDDDKLAILLPSPVSRISVSIDFDSPVIGTQSYSFAPVDGQFESTIAGARTFGFRAQVEALKARGLVRGGSLRNAVLIDRDRVVNDEGLRFRDEFARHKALDCLGDLSLSGPAIMAHLYTHKPGHALNNALLHKLFAQRDAWSYLTMDEYCDLADSLSPMGHAVAG
jgi:UDP-3-O-[3-hydroxymyristoyl] N-acetylglucosamine deacetylase